MTRFAIALGSNQGARLDHLRRAVADLRRAGAIVAVSPLYETAPIGGPSQAPYLNAVLLLDSSFAPSDLLGLLQEVETAHGRVRDLRWGPRTLDLDIVAMDEGPVDTPELQVPHPRAARAPIRHRTAVPGTGPARWWERPSRQPRPRSGSKIRKWCWWPPIGWRMIRKRPRMGSNDPGAEWSNRATFGSWEAAAALLLVRT